MSKPKTIDLGKARQMIKRLIKRYPNTFFPDGAKRPLRTGIHVDLRRACRTWNQENIRNALRAYICTPEYQQAIISGTRRVGIDGIEYEEIKEKEREKARLDLAKMLIDTDRT